MTADMQTNIRASRRRVARSRGALSGILLVILGAWAALVPFIGPYFNLAFTPRPNTAWHWTSARGWLEVLPGAAVLLGGLLLLVSASRAATVFGGWLAALGGAWLVIGPSLADPLNLDVGTPDPSSSTGARALEALLFFYAVGAAILFFASLALGRVSVLSVRDVRAAERRAEAEETERRAAVEAAAAEEEARRRDAARDAARASEQDGAGRHAEGAPNEHEAATSNGGRRGGLFHRHHDEAAAEPRTASAAPTQQYPNAPAAPQQGEGYPAQQNPNDRPVAPNQEQYGTNRPR
jgi:hypothetical protein